MTLLKKIQTEKNHI